MDVWPWRLGLESPNERGSLGRQVKIGFGLGDGLFTDGALFLSATIHNDGGFERTRRCYEIH